MNMKEHLNNGEQEMLAAYGESLNAAPSEASEGLSTYPDQEVGIIEEEVPGEAAAQAYFESLPQEERQEAESITMSLENIEENLENESALISRRAGEALVATVLAGLAPQVEGREPTLGERLMSAVPRGVHNTVKAIALSATLAAPAVAQEYMHPNPEITKKVDYLFGTSVFERLGTQRASLKRDYTELEMRKRDIQQRIRELGDPRPHSTAEAAHIQRVEADRDAKLAALNVERTLENMAFQNLHSNDPVDRAKYEANIAEIAAREARVIEDCEAQLLAEHHKIASPKEIEDLHRELIRIERNENELVRRFRTMQRTSYGPSWNYFGR
jgi:hypothetical protein